LAVAAASGAAGLWYGKRAATRPLPRLTSLTSERGVVYDARFTPDGRTVVYSAAWDGKPPEVFSARVESPVPRPFGFPPGGIQSVSPSGDLALLRSRQGNVGWPKLGTLARVPFAGGAPRDVLDDVASADWAPDGSLCVLRRVGAEMQVDWPIGTVLYRSPGIPHANGVRVSPRGDVAVFAEPTSSGPALRLTDRGGRVRTITSLSGPRGYMGWAWSPGGRELWYVDDAVLHAVDLSGRSRVIHGFGNPCFLFDVSAEGRVLMSYWRNDTRVRGRAPGDPADHDLAALNFYALALSPDGEFLLGRDYRLGHPLLVPLRGGDPVNLGWGGQPDSWAVSLASGGVHALFREPGPPPRLLDVPTGAGEPRALPLGTVEPVTAEWLGDGRTLLIQGHEPGRPDRLFVKRPEDATPRPVTPEGVFVGSFAASPEGAWVAVHETPRIRCYPVAGGEPREVPGYDGHDVLLGWSGDGRTLYLRRDPDALAAPARLFRLDVQSGRQTPWMELGPPDRTALMWVSPVRLARDGQAYVYRCARTPHDLYIVDGLK
jgi:dipeptidyl aminopeptidase/acylaminoacyl peptidase